MTKASGRRSKTSGHALILGVYVAAVFLSALLLFGVQPMFTRMVLPRLGGSPSVWSIAMVFFQSMLLVGYAYAHLLMSSRNRYVPIVVHIALLIVAALTLPLSIADSWGTPPTGAAAPFWLLGLFAVSIGLPFFALAANNPLMQAWFAETRHPDARDPYFLYAASNIGSFLALLSYPILFEPVFTLRAQGRLWTIAFSVLIVLVAGCGALMLRNRRRIAASKKTAADTKPGWAVIGRWIFISAVPSGLLVAVTAYVSTDIAAAPLLWVIPLSLYLLTWILVFQRRPLIPHRIMLLLQPFAIAGIVLLLYYAGWVPLLDSLAAHLVAFFIIAMACHGELSRTRPAPQHLTTFYVSLSLGGMVGGLFSGLLAPYAFSWIAEYPILAAIAVLCRPFGQEGWKPFERLLWPLAPSCWPQIKARFWPVAMVIGLALLFSRHIGFDLDEDPQLLKVIILTLAAASLVLLRDPLKSAFAVALAMIWLYPPSETHPESVRSFFGVHKIYESEDGRFRILKHGSTIHGAQQLENDNGEPATGRPKPITYYHDKSAMSGVIEALRARKGGPLQVGVIGLGTGTLACLSAPGETWRFFEIDPTIVEIARDSDRFTFLASCSPQLPIVIGDARLTLTKEPDHRYDLIIVDAYSSDAIPVHLATTEAMALYKSKLTPHGVVLMHISNRHLELRSVVEGIAAANGLKTWIWRRDKDEADDGNFVFTSDVAISAENAEDIGTLARDGSWVWNTPDPAVRTWTDDYSNVAGAIWRKYAR
ncbi:MAG: fused MFS/spermidine synthase [Pseudolabrys sp.]